MLVAPALAPRSGYPSGWRTSAKTLTRAPHAITGSFARSHARTIHHHDFAEAQREFDRPSRLAQLRRLCVRRQRFVSTIITTVTAVTFVIVVKRQPLVTKRGLCATRTVGGPWLSRESQKRLCRTISRRERGNSRDFPSRSLVARIRNEALCHLWHFWATPAGVSPTSRFFDVILLPGDSLRIDPRATSAG